VEVTCDFLTVTSDLPLNIEQVMLILSFSDEEDQTSFVSYFFLLILFLIIIFKFFVFHKIALK